LQGPNLYDLVIDANISGGGTAGRLEKQGQGGLRLNGTNSQLTGSNEVQTIAVPNNVSRFVISFGGQTSDVINFVDSNAVVQPSLRICPARPGNDSDDRQRCPTQNYILTFQNALGGYDSAGDDTSGQHRASERSADLTTAPGHVYLSYGNFVSPPITYAPVTKFKESRDQQRR
jgi:hypothetical protein